MSDEAQGSVTRAIGHLKAGANIDVATQKLWERFFDKLVRLAHRQLQAMHQSGGPADGEDAALSAFDNFFDGVQRGEFPQLRDRDDLWRLLLKITTRKVLNRVDHERRLKRGGGKVAGEASLGGAEGGGFAQIAGHEPTPELVALVADECRRLLDGLGDEKLRQIAIWKMEGYTSEEIAAKLGCSQRTVANKLELIKRAWHAERLP